MRSFRHCGIEEIRAISTDSEVRASQSNRNGGSYDQVPFLFLWVFSECLLGHTDNLSSTLQNSWLTASEVQEIAEVTCTAVYRMKMTELFDLFWKRVDLLQQQQLRVDSANLPRKRKVPAVLEIGDGEVYHPTSAKDHCCRQYYECIDVMLSSIWTNLIIPFIEYYTKIQKILVESKERTTT